MEGEKNEASEGLVNPESKHKNSAHVSCEIFQINKEIKNQRN